MFQEAASLTMRAIVNLHNDIMSVLILIVSVVSWLLFLIIRRFREKNKKNLRTEFVHQTALEVI